MYLEIWENQNWFKSVKNNSQTNFQFFIYVGEAGWLFWLVWILVWQRNPFLLQMAKAPILLAFGHSKRDPADFNTGKLQMPWFIGLGGSQPYSRGEFQEPLWERFRGLSRISLEFPPESPTAILGIWPRGDILMSREKNCCEPIVVSQVSRNCPHRGGNFERGFKALSSGGYCRDQRKGSFGKEIFSKMSISRDSREFRDSREPQACGKQRGIRPVSGDSREF